MNTIPISGGINVETNNTCNLRCPLCPVNNGMERNRGFMSLEMWQRLALELAGIGVRDVELVGFGEPLLHPELTKMVEHGINCGLRIHISTNTMLLDMKMQKELLGAGITSITVCLDGATAKSHEEYRRRSNFIQTFSNIRSLVETRNHSDTKTQIILQTLVTKFNEYEIEQIGELVKLLQADQHRLKTVALGTYQSELDRQESARYWLPNDMALTRYDYANGKYLAKQTAECPWWNHLPFILWNGDVTTCCHDYDGIHTFATLKTKSLSAILNDMVLVRENIRQRMLKLCRQCQQTYIRNLPVISNNTAPSSL